MGMLRMLVNMLNITVWKPTVRPSIAGMAALTDSRVSS